jgi:adenine-specific DNA-methyltransferase
MEIDLLNLRKSINKAYLKVKPNRTQIETFKKNIIYLFSQIKESESEEFHKNIISEFLRNTYYSPNHYINTKGRSDLVIHNGKDSNSSVGVLFEVKKPNNKSELPTTESINCKAFQELILYYLRERITNRNLEIKNLVITNTFEWFIFNSNDFEKLFAENKSFVKQFIDFEEGRLSGTNTDFFYKNIAEPYVNCLQSCIPVTHFDIREFESIIKNADKGDDNKLIALYKILSREHLLKLPFANDSNNLDKTFYSELLHIIGLEETKEGNKKIIGRKIENRRNPGSLIENSITILKYEDCLSQLPKLSDYGNTSEEQLFNISLELVITWINRILFLKLLEGQLIKYNSGDKEFRLLNIERIPDYDELNKLFFQVLAVKESDRSEIIRQKFRNIPYLNSSLFEPVDLEHKTIRVNSLDDHSKLPVLTATVLKDRTGKKITGDIDPLQYLFEFLDSYDFSSEGSEDIQEENKTLINASVLGLIFEKINGYKDGSFFTPGFITMYMCHETIRMAVIQKFNEVKGWTCDTLNDVYNRIEDIKEANKIVNSLRICDPAVGSGHFLVSALNEIISIKSELRILTDREGKKLKEYSIEVVNDELIITDEQSKLYDYNPKSKESQRVQEALFQEKQRIIENCLFGVDINSNSVKICRLRLWIELLKNAYYKPDTNYRELETLPNIDINIKCGNSLISRYPLDADIKTALKSSKWNVDNYREAIMTYRNAQTKDEKHSMEQLISKIKNDFETEVSKNDKRFLKLNRLNGELLSLTSQSSLFELAKKQKEEWNKKVLKLTEDIKKYETEIEEIRGNTIYEKAFEWRFEFPEVLNNEGDFVGFDVVIGNPPYIRIQDLIASHEASVLYYNSYYKTAGDGNYDLYIPFAEKGVELLKNRGSMCYIMPHKFINANYGKQLRGFIGERKLLEKLVHFGAAQVFEDATTYTGLFFISKKENTKVEYCFLNEIDSFHNNDYPIFMKSPSNLLTSEQWMFLDSAQSNLLDKIQNWTDTLETKTDRIFQGVKTSADKIYIVEKLNEFDKLYEVFCKENNKIYQLEKNYLYPLIKGGNSSPYHIKEPDLLLLFPYTNGELVLEETIKNEAPKTWDYFKEHKKFLESRENNSFIGKNWYSFGRNQAINIIKKRKIFTPDIAPSPRFSFDDEGEYTFTGGVAGGYGIVPKEECDYKFLLAILNSKVAFWFITKVSTQMRGGWYSFESRYIKNIPIPLPEKIQKSKIELLVSQILKDKKENLLVETTSIESEINQLVYQLYGLTNEEIRIIEST